MAINELKEKLHQIIDTTNNEILLEDLLNEAEDRMHASKPHEIEGLSEEDFNNLTELVNEDPEKDTISYEEFKSAFPKWFTK